MKKLEKKSFNNIMNEIRESMKPSQKVLSKIFHFRPIEIFLDFIHLRLLPSSSNMFIISHMDSKFNNADFLLLNDGFYDKV